MNAAAIGRIPKTAGIWSKLNPVTTNRKLSYLLRSYIDETTKIQPGNPVPSSRGDGPMGNPRVQNHIPFGAGIWTFGHVANELARRGLDPSKAQPVSTVPAMEAWWLKDRESAAMKAHHITASFDPRIAKDLNRIGYPIDAMLLSTLHDTLTMYASKFYPGETLGYVVGCHHDTDNPHCHALIHPTTSSGKLIRVSENDRDQPEAEDRFHFLRHTFNLRARQLLASLRRDLNPARTADSSLAYWLLLCRKAMLDANPESIDAAYAAARKMAQVRGRAEVASEVAVSLRLADSDASAPRRGQPSPDRVHARWGEIREAWATVAKEGSDAAFGALNATRDPQLAGDYKPALSTNHPPVPACRAQYLALANRASEAPVSNAWEASAARLAESAKHRARVAEGHKAYRSAIDRGVAEMDALVARCGFAAAQLMVLSAATLGTRPGFLEGVTEIDEALAIRVLPSRSRIESMAERSMMFAAEQEAECHKPEAPSEVTSIFAKAHTPRFRQLRVPAAISADAQPIIGP